MKPKYLLWAAWTMYAVAWVLPVCGSSADPHIVRGFEAFFWVFISIFEIYHVRSWEGLWSRLLFFLPAVTNLAMLCTPLLHDSWLKRRAAAFAWLAFAAFLIDAQFLFLGGAASEDFPLRIGYYLWLGSFLLLAASMFLIAWERWSERRSFWKARLVSAAKQFVRYAKATAAATKPKYILWAAWTMYTVSWFLPVIGTRAYPPALDVRHAYQWALGTITHYVHERDFHRFLLLMPLSAMSNIVMLCSPLVLAKRFRRDVSAYTWVALFAIAIDAHFLVLGLGTDVSMGYALREGYFLWLGSFVLLAASLSRIVRENKSARASTSNRPA